MRVSAGRTPPFLEATGDELSPGGWCTEDGTEVPRLLVDWDPVTQISLHRNLVVSGPEIADNCALEPSTECVLGCTWEGTATRLRGRGTIQQFNLKDERRGTVAVDIPGRLLGGILNVRTFLAVVDPRPSGALGAARPGEILWTDRKRVVLEGDDSRFPVNVIDFSDAAMLQSAAGWMLTWQSREFEEPFGASMRLLVNSGEPGVRDAVVTGSESDAADVIRRSIRIDTARTLLGYGLGSDEFIEAATDYEEGTVGRAIADLIARIFGSLDAGAVRAMRDEQPGEFDARIQAHLMADG